MGAELCSVLHSNGIEYMWQAEKVWSKHSPILFPIVGTLVNNTFIYDEQSYVLPRHGFAREMEFTPTLLSETEAQFTLSSNADTLKKYPFHFRLQIHYQLQEDNLTCTYMVENTGKQDMYFSIGGHPAFAVPILPTEKYSDYSLQFEQDEPLLRWKLQDGLLSTTTLPVVGQQSNRLPLRHQLFYEDAIVLKGLHSKSISIRSETGPHGVQFNIASFPHVGIWGAKDANFVCIEPWCGHADLVNHNQQLTTKEGIEKLEANGFWQRSWTAKFF